MRTRQAGARKIVIGGLGACAAWALFAFMGKQGYMLTSFGLIPFGVPGAYALSGLLEVVTGVEFTHIARKWDELAGWQRGLLGLLVVVLAFVAMMGLIVLFG